MVRLSTSLLAAAGLSARHALAALPPITPGDLDSMKPAAKDVIDDMLTFYKGDEPGWVPGILPGPPPDGDYYWWQGGAMWGVMIDYRFAFGDKSYDDTISSAMLFQVGDNRDYMPANWSASMGNDDQAFWALSAMLAAETGYPNPPEDQPQWLALAQAVYNEQSMDDRRVTSGGRCNGSLRWQVFPSNNGYNYINTIANACFFNIGARLARYTGNDTYMETVEKTWVELEKLGYITDDGDVYDGAHLPDCTDINKAQFSYNAALLIQGAAFLYNHTNADTKWKNRIDKLLDRSLKVFWPDGIAFEPSCETGGCNADMESYKGYAARWFASTAQLAPYTYPKIMPVLKSSLVAAVKQCTGGSNGRFCGFHWKSGSFDGEIGASQQMNVVSAMMSTIYTTLPSPFTNSTGGTSIGDANAGSGSSTSTTPNLLPITMGDKAGAGILTALFIAGACSAFAWMSID